MPLNVSWPLPPSTPPSTPPPSTSTRPPSQSWWPPLELLIYQEEERIQNNVNHSITLFENEGTPWIHSGNPPPLPPPAHYTGRLRVPVTRKHLITFSTRPDIITGTVQQFKKYKPTLIMFVGSVSSFNPCGRKSLYVGGQSLTC